MAEVVDESGLRALLSHDRLVVFFTVEWSGPERVARRCFRAAAERLSDSRVRCVIAPEECPLAHEVLSRGNAVPGGWGPVAWLSRGEVLHILVRGDQAKPEDLVQKTTTLFPQ